MFCLFVWCLLWPETSLLFRVLPVLLVAAVRVVTGLYPVLCWCILSVLTGWTVLRWLTRTWELKEINRRGCGSRGGYCICRWAVAWFWHRTRCIHAHWVQVRWISWLDIWIWHNNTGSQRRGELHGCKSARHRLLSLVVRWWWKRAVLQLFCKTGDEVSQADIGSLLNKEAHLDKLTNTWDVTLLLFVHSQCRVGHVDGWHREIEPV